MRHDSHKINLEVAHGARNLRRRFAFDDDGINLQAVEEVIRENVFDLRAQSLQPNFVLLVENALRQCQQIRRHTALLHTEEHHAPAPLARKRRRILQSSPRVQREICRKQNILKWEHKVKQKSESRIQESEEK